MRVIHNFAQGSEAWHQHRARAFNASEAAACLGASKYLQRSEMLRQKATGLLPEVNAAKQALFDRGHAVEGPTLAIVQELTGEDFAPVVASIEVDGMVLGASYDGLSLMEDFVWENKLWNEDLARQVQAGELEPHCYWQLEQQLLVVGAERAIFTCSDGTREKFVSMEYRPVPGRAEQLRAAWKQFAADLAVYEPAAPADAKPTGKAPETLPALRIEVTGMVTASNLTEFKQTALAVFGGINRTLTTDADFANAEQTVKWCGDVEDRLAAAKQHALSQTESIDAMFRTIDEISAEARRVRLELDKLVKARKEAIRGEIVAGGVVALAKHIGTLNAAMPAAYMPSIPVDFGGVVKGKRTIDSLRDAVDTELARAKIAASEIANRIHVNIQTIRDSGIGIPVDVASLVLKAPDDMAAVIAQRAAAEKAKEEEQRERIRVEEERKAKAAVQAEQDRIREEVDIKARNDLLNEQAAITAAQTPTAESVSEQPLTLAKMAAAVMPAPVAKLMGADTGIRIKLGEINSRIAPLSISADGLDELGFPYVAHDKNAKLYRESDWPAICEALIKHITVAAAE